MGPAGHPCPRLGHCLPHHLEGPPLIGQGNTLKGIGTQEILSGKSHVNMLKVSVLD